jgi:hypothetical protein
MKARKFAVLLVLLLQSIVLCGQEISLKHFTTEDGLPSQNINDIYQDKSGYLWLASQNGISLFNGEVFQILPDLDEINNSSVIKIIEYRDTLFFLTYEGELYSYKHELQKVFELSKTEQRELKGFLSHAILFDDQLLINDFYGNLYVFYLINGTKEIIRPVSENHVFIIEGENDFIYALNENLPLELKNKSIHVFSEQSFQAENYHVHFSGADSQKVLIINKWEFLLDEKAVKSKKECDNPFTAFYQDGFSRIAAHNSQGINYKNQVGDHVELLKDFTIKQILKDMENGYWFVTDNQGLFYVPSFRFQMIEGFSNSIYKYSSVPKALLFVTYNNKVGLIDENFSVSVLDDIVLKGNYIIEDIFGISKDKIWLLCSFYEENETNIQKGNLKAFLFEKNGNWAITKTKEFEGTNELALTPLDDYRERFLELGLDLNGNIYISSLISFLDNREKTLSFIDQKDLNVSVRITDQIHIAENNISSYLNYGLAFFNYSGNVSTFNSRNSNLPSNNIKSLFQRDSNSFYAGSNRGLSFVEMKNEKLEILNFNKHDGLFDLNINDIDTFKNHVFLASNKGNIFFNPLFPVLKNSIPEVQISQVSINGRDTLFLQNYELSPKENNIIIQLRAASLKHPDHLRFRYRLKENARWNIVKTNQINLDDIRYGSYTFQVQVSVNGENWSVNTAKISFKIATPFTKTIFFIILVVFISTLAVSLVWSYIYNNQKKLFNQQKQLNNTKRDLILSEQKALRAQMDPHFIFNSLNSIRNFALENNQKELDQYIDDFSTLFRKFLYSSDDNKIKISEEIEFLDLYLKIEKIRLNNILEYQIETEISEDDFDDKIPSMILQPLVENSIWHGLMPKEEDRKIKIGFYNINDEYLKIVIEDNGIGRKKASELGRKRKKHKSFGYGSVEERIKLFGDLNKKDISIETIDLYSKEKPIGTRIIIKSKY